MAVRVSPADAVRDGTRVPEFDPVGGGVDSCVVLFSAFTYVTEGLRLPLADWLGECDAEELELCEEVRDFVIVGVDDAVLDDDDERDGVKEGEGDMDCEQDAAAVDPAGQHGHIPEHALEVRNRAAP